MQNPKSAPHLFCFAALPILVPSYINNHFTARVDPERGYISEHDGCVARVIVRYANGLGFTPYAALVLSNFFYNFNFFRQFY